MPAPFAEELCKYRQNGKPNTSDASDALSVEVGRALFDILGVSEVRSAEKDEPTDGELARLVTADLSQRFAGSPKGVVVSPERRIYEFEQYRHIGVRRDVAPGPSKEFNAAWRRLTTYVRRRASGAEAKRLDVLIASVESVVADEGERLRRLLDEMGDEWLLRLDLTVSTPGPADRLPRLDVGLSLKWSLRTDRAQDARSQGAKLSALRRGRMPHFGVITMEPRPVMLNLLGGGSGDLDCVYHLDLPALQEAVESVYTSGQRLRGRDLFRRLVDQRRIRDYDELVAEIEVLA